MEGEEQQLKFQVILPSLVLPDKLSHVKSEPVSQFLVGYRNVIEAGEKGLSWGIVKNENYCCKAYAY